MNVALWIVQGLLALAFLFAGAFKGFMPLDNIKKSMPWANHVPAWLVRFIGISELLGGIGLIVPAVTRILPWLTEAAAGGLILVMICAAVYHGSRREFSGIGVTVVLLLLAAFILVGRLVWVPLT